MAWIESHQELRHHYKTKRLARELKVTAAAAVGHLHFLWWWAVDFAPDGDLTKFDDEEIADAMGYEGKDPTKAKAALIFAGFLDNTEHGTVTIHDWQEYAGRTLGQREKARQRARNYREKQSAQATDSTQATTRRTRRTEKVAYADGTHTLPEQSADETESGGVSYASTVHNSTEHDSTPPDSTGTDTPPLPPASGGRGDGEDAESRFDAFWRLYPKKQGKGAAVKAWKKIKMDKRLFETIMAKVQENIDRNQNWRRNNGQYIPNPATWLNEQRWADTIGVDGMPAQRGGAASDRIGGADDYHDFQRSTGFRSTDRDPDTDG